MLLHIIERNFISDYLIKNIYCYLLGKYNKILNKKIYFILLLKKLLLYLYQVKK